MKETFSHVVSTANYFPVPLQNRSAIKNKLDSVILKIPP